LGNIIIKPVHDFINGKRCIWQNKVGAKMQDVVRLESLTVYPIVGTVGAVFLNKRFTQIFRFNESRDMDQLAGRVVGTMHPGKFQVCCQRKYEKK
jgi:hypothetical protein